MPLAKKCGCKTEPKGRRTVGIMPGLDGPWEVRMSRDVSFIPLTMFYRCKNSHFPALLSF